VSLLARAQFPDENALMPSTPAPTHEVVFGAGRIVLVTLSSPREKFWGALLGISPAGVSARGLQLTSYEEVAYLLRSGEAVTPADVFFPLHRVERVELDASAGELPSLAERFRALSGKDASAFFGVDI
jgi:hypothetical protein